MSGLPDPGRVPPFHAPPFTPEWSCPTFRRISVICEADPDQLEALVAPTPFQLGGSRIEIFHDDMSAHTLGSFDESGLCVPVVYGEVTGLMHAVIFITTDIGLMAGREVFGYPKVLGQVDVVIEGDSARGETRRDGLTLMRVTLEGPMEPVDPGEMTGLADTARGEEWEWSHHLLARSLPRVDGHGADVDQVIYRNLQAVPTSVRTATARLDLAEHPLLGGLTALEPVAAYVIDAGFGHQPEERRILRDASTTRR